MEERLVENNLLRGELDQVQEKLRVLEAKLLDHSNHSEVYFDWIYDLEHWREVQEASVTRHDEGEEQVVLMGSTQLYTTTEFLTVT